MSLFGELKRRNFQRVLAVTAIVLMINPVSAAPGVETHEETRRVSERYLELELAGDYDALKDIYAKDMVFFDPTGDVFPGPVSQGTVTGVDAIIAMQKGWGLAEQDFKVDQAFFVGEYAMHRGTLTVRYKGGTEYFPFPFVTVHRVSDGKLTERTDFGEYIQTFRLGDQWDANTQSTREVADGALAAYLGADLETTAELAAEDIQFQDPTSKVFGPPAGELYQGRDELIDRRRQIYENVRDFDLRVEKSFYTNHHAVYMGMTTYRIGERVWTQPAVFVFEVRDGRVTRQWDFVDYTVGPGNG